MSKRDFFQVAFDSMQEVTGYGKSKPEATKSPIPKGHFGGLKGGPARAASLSGAKRKEIARKAAAARWKK